MLTSRLLLLFVVLTAGCDPVPWAEDGIAPTAGLAQSHNLQVHTAGVSSSTVRWPNPGGDGGRAARVMEEYRAGTETETAEP